MEHLRDTLSHGGFLENDVFESIARRSATARSRRRPRARRSTRARPIRATRTSCGALLARYLDEAPEGGRLPAR